ncbi:hypothetical protein BCV72DRAFT_214928, partial [Rhizopus microsporus var. microsporus]
VSHKAASIVKQALAPGAVVFFFPEGLLFSRQATYHAIQGQLRALKGVECLSMYSTKPSPALIVEVLFGGLAHARKAIYFGIKVKDIIYQASPLDATAATVLTRVQLDFSSMPNCDTLISYLIQFVQ